MSLCLSVCHQEKERRRRRRTRLNFISKFFLFLQPGQFREWKFDHNPSPAKDAGGSLRCLLASHQPRDLLPGFKIKQCGLFYVAGEGKGCEGPFYPHLGDSAYSYLFFYFFYDIFYYLPHRATSRMIICKAADSFRVCEQSVYVKLLLLLL